MKIRPILPLVLAVLGVGLPRIQAEDPTKFDPSQQADKVAPGPDTTKPVESIELKRDDRVQNSRAVLPGLIDEPRAPMADRRAPIDVTETRDKTIIDHKVAPVATEPLAHQESRFNGQLAPAQLRPTDIFPTSMVEKYETGLRNADTASRLSQPTVAKATSFDKLNRFVFRRNGPGTDGGAALVTPAGRATPPPVQSSSEPLKILGGTAPVMPGQP